MHVIANDVAQSGVFAAEPLVDGESLSVVVADDLDNLVMFHPSTKHQTLDNSFFGHERAAKVFLRCVADFHLGAAPSTFIGSSVPTLDMMSMAPTSAHPSGRKRRVRNPLPLCSFTSLRL